VKAERDKYQTQLDPFLAIAERRFPDEPTNKRLELLLTRLDKVINDVQSAARKVSPERTLGAELEQTLIANLKSSHHINTSSEIFLKMPKTTFGLQLSVVAFFK